MYTQFYRLLALGALAIGLPATASAQSALPVPVAVAQPAAPAFRPYPSACGQPLATPVSQPPAGSAPVLVAFELCFEKQGGRPILDGETYLYYVKVNSFVSASSSNKWIPYTETVQQTMREDFKRLLDQGFLDDILIEVNDYTFPNGVIGKVASYHMEERERVKTVRYEGTKQVERTKIEEQLRDLSITIGVDSFLDEAKIRRVEGVVREMMREKGFNAEISHKVEPIPGGLKTVNLTFQIDEGPRRKIKRIVMTGNTAFSDTKLTGQMKENKKTGMLSFITGTGTVNQTKFEEDAERIEDYYQNRGYPKVRVGTPEVKLLEKTKDGKTQWIELDIPVTEGSRYMFGDIDFDGNKRFPGQAIRSLYAIAPGEMYSRKKLVEGNRKVQEVYGSLGYMEFTPFPDFTFSDDGGTPETVLDALVPPALALAPSDKPAPAAGTAAPPDSKQEGKLPAVDVTIRITEGEQFFINRIVFTGNTTTRDNVIRRELGTLLEGAPFNTEALKFSVKRINQLGYFKPFEANEKGVKVDKSPNQPNMVDITMKLEEQNRNQLTFGAGVSQYEGFFGQLAFQTSNFMGRGETLSLSVQGGQRAKNYQVGFTRPFLFDKNITGGIDVHRRELEYVGYYTQKSTGGGLTFGLALRAFTRAFINYSFEQVSIGDLNEALIDSSCLASSAGCSTISSLSDLSQLTPEQQANLCKNPYVCDSLLLGSNGERVISKVTPSLLHNTVDHPIFPTSGKKYTLQSDFAVLGGNTQYIKPHLEGIWFFRHTSRTTLGLRAQFEYITPVGRTTLLPVFERLFLGGEYSIRGFDVRSIGPTVEGSPIVLGGNKSLLVNAEYMFSVAGPVRVLGFFDAGQVRDFGEPFTWKEDITDILVPPPPPVTGLIPEIVADPNAPLPIKRVIGQTYAFKASTGVELRFFMPVLNVPFRLIYAFNPSRTGVLDNDLSFAKASVFRFAVGTTF